MPGFKTHLFGSAFVFALLVSALTVLSPFLGEAGLVISRAGILKSVGLFLICLLGGLWPDIDTKSKVQKIFYFFLFSLDLYFIFTKRYFPAAILGLVSMIPLLDKHRGWTHTKMGALLMTSPILIVPMVAAEGVIWVGLPFFIAAIAGYFTHLAIDGKLW